MNRRQEDRRPALPKATRKRKALPEPESRSEPETSLKAEPLAKASLTAKRAANPKPKAKPRPPSKPETASSRKKIEQRVAAVPAGPADLRADLHLVEKQLVRQTEAIARHERQIARHTAIQTWTNIVTFVFGLVTTAFLLYLTNNQLGINARQLATSERQVSLEYAKAAPSFSVSVIRYEASSGPSYAVLPAGFHNGPKPDQFAPYRWLIGVRPDLIIGDRKLLANKLANITGYKDSDYFYRRLISDTPFAFLDEDAPDKVAMSMTRWAQPGISLERVPASLTEKPSDSGVVQLPSFPQSVTVTLERGEATIKRVTNIQDITFILTYGSGRFNACTVRVQNYFTVGNGITQFPVSQIATMIATTNVIKMGRDINYIAIIPSDTAVEIEYVDVFGNDRAALFSGTGVNLDKVPIARSSRRLDRPRAWLRDASEVAPPRLLKEIENSGNAAACRALV